MLANPELITNRGSLREVQFDISRVSTVKFDFIPT